jgi:DNA helicase-2/ATP-dependent DNA helicase PcrA
MSADVFAEHYKKLNAQQRLAVDTIEGPVMVIAGPGTGKTSILTLRIANILRLTDTPANGILALTFTESGVHSMRRKLASYIGSSAYRVHLFTFHGFAQEIISRYPEYFPRIIGGAIASDSERYSILEDALSKGEFEIIRPFGKPLMYVRKAMSAIQDLKRDGVDPDAFKRILVGEEKAIKGSDDLYHESGRAKGSMKRMYVDALRNNAKNKELATLYKRYEELLHDRSLYDYDDMLGELVGALKKNDSLLRTLQEEYLYILADEHQDANNSQNAVLELLSNYRDTRNLFIVGDEKQAIYRFQGASLENFLYFKKRYPDAVVIFLDSNYRSTQTILDASHALMTTGDVPLLVPRPRLIAEGEKRQESVAVIVTDYDTTDDEDEGVAKQIKQDIEQGYQAEDVAVLVRTNAELSEIGRVLEGFKIPFTVFTDDDVLADLDIGKLIRLFRAIVSPDRDELIAEMLFIDFLGVHPIDAVKIIRTAKESRRSVLDLLSHKEGRPAVSDGSAVDSLARNFMRWMLSANNGSALDAFLSIIEDVKFQEYLLTKRQSLEKIEKVAKLYDEIKTYMVAHKDATLKSFMASIDTLLRHGSPISFSRRSLGARGVHVMTAHKAKGLEWKKVYIPHALDAVWGNRRTVSGFKLPPPLGGGEDSEQNEDERRLFYVALTRAKQSVVISYSRVDVRGKDRDISQFVSELPASCIALVRGTPVESSERLARATVRHTQLTRTIWDTAYLREIFEEQGLNATALNNYLECPWKYFFKNLVRLPEAQSPHLHFGNAVHSALKFLADERHKENVCNEESVLAVFERELSRKPLAVNDFKTTLLKGKKILPIYYAKRASLWHTNTITEFDISGVHIDIPNGQRVLLRGRIDKIELLPGGAVNVVDYKTGSRKTRNEILGKTKNASGDIKRQLDFYRLLLELHDAGAYTMVSADVDFIEPSEAGVLYPLEHFEMSHEDAERIRLEIIRVAQEIMEFNFAGRGCGEKECTFCRLSTLIDNSSHT